MQVRVCPKCGNQNKPSLTVCEMCHASLINMQNGPTIEKTQQVPVMSSIQQPQYNRTIQGGPPPMQNQQYIPNQHSGYTPPAPYKGLPKSEGKSRSWAISVLVIVFIAGFGLIAWDMFGRPDRGYSTKSNALIAGKATRQIVNGDTSVYDFEASFDINNSKVLKESGMGTMTCTFKQGSTNTRFGVEYRDFTLVYTLKSQNTISLEEYYSQGSDGTIYYCGYKELDIAPPCRIEGDVKAVFIPGTLKNGLSWNYNVTYNNRITESAEFKVVGTEWIETPAGKFETYKIQFSETKSIGRNTSGYIWVTPEHPLGVKQDVEFSTMGNNTIDINSTIKTSLTSYNYK